MDSKFQLRDASRIASLVGRLDFGGE